MDQTVLMHTHVDEGTEGRDVGNHAFELHTFLQVLEGVNVFAKLGCVKFLARVTPCLSQ